MMPNLAGSPIRTGCSLGNTAKAEVHHSKGAVAPAEQGTQGMEPTWLEGCANLLHVACVLPQHTDKACPGGGVQLSRCEPPHPDRRLRRKLPRSSAAKLLTCARSSSTDARSPHIANCCNHVAITAAATCLLITTFASRDRDDPPQRMGAAPGDKHSRWRCCILHVRTR